MRNDAHRLQLQECWRAKIQRNNRNEKHGVCVAGFGYK